MDSSFKSLLVGSALGMFAAQGDCATAAAPLAQSALQFVDTAGANFDEELEPDGESRLNRQEAELVRRKPTSHASVRGEAP